METFWFGSVSGALVLFWLLTGIGLVLGLVAYLVCAYPSLRRPRYQSARPRPLLGALLGAAVVLAITGTTYHLRLRCFYRLDVDADAVYLTYFLPERQVRISREDIRELKPGITLDRGADMQLHVLTADGKSYASATVTLDRFREHLAKLETFVHP